VTASRRLARTRSSRRPEFVQFHPTALDSDASPRFITEALRGEGASADCEHQRFMVDIHPLAEPRCATS
jgi:L-aspartate oxidase